MISLHQLLKAAVKQGASDLHIVAGSPPVLRVEGRIVRVKSSDLTADETRQLCYSILTDSQKSRFETTKELDFSFGIKAMSRFRANLFYQRGAVSGVFRRIPVDVPDLEVLGLPKIVAELVNYPTGLVLVTGPTGSGKSTTIAAMIDRINRERRGHIITLEDPIEYVHPHKSSIVNQREVGIDTVSYRSALKHVLRQDPDVCMMGELRDLETVDAALNICETGHLVFATLHTNSAVSTISRIVNVFPSEQQERVRTQLSLTLNAVLSQRLVPGIKG
ncbi:MAG: type IV pilus twitching motility protein PilT, partial [Bdellovibrionales bacterium]